MNDKAYTKQLISGLLQEHLDLNAVKSIDLVVSFIQPSGLRKLRKFLYEAVLLQIPIRIITSTYMNITSPEALTELLSYGTGISVKLYQGDSPSFHPKAYFVHCQDAQASYMFVGSSNISKAALTNGVEWNYRIEFAGDASGFLTYCRAFEEMFENDCYPLSRDVIVEYRKHYISPKENKYVSKMNRHFQEHQKNHASRKEKRSASDSSVASYQYLQPNAAQIEALYELKTTRDENNNKALIVAATGIGKTYLVAFDSQGFERILFIAHREEILKQAYETFGIIRPQSKRGRLFGEYKEMDADIIFASVQSLSKKLVLSNIPEDCFQYVVFDEVHHGVANSYQRIMNHIKPEFMVGLTATPHRYDQKDIFALFDYNTIYEVDLFQAINRAWLVPFHYYGIYDSTVDYQNVTFLKGRYVDKELERALAINERAELVYKHFMKHRKHSALAFCSSIYHAEYMTDYFVKHGIKAVSVHSDSTKQHYCDRVDAIDRLKNGMLNILFTVDMFNEGVDIPMLDLLLFLRPTESSTVFLQQLGRGLRLYKNKQYVKVLDFIGNFKNVELLPGLLGKKRELSLSSSGMKTDDFILPEDCYVDFDFEVIDLLEKALKGKQKLQDLIRAWYFECKKEINDNYSTYNAETTGINLDGNDLVVAGEQNEIAYGKKNEVAIAEHNEITSDENNYDIYNKRSRKRTPGRNDFFLWLDEDKYAILKRNTNMNPFRDFSRFQNSFERIVADTEINEDLVENSFLDTPEHKFVNMIERTSMAKMYKIPVFQSFVESGNVFRKQADMTEIVESFKTFYNNNRNKKDMVRDKATRESYAFKVEQWQRLAKSNPIRFLCERHSDIFEFDGQTLIIKLDFSWSDSSEARGKYFISQVLDAIQFRRNEFLDQRLED